MIVSDSLLPSDCYKAEPRVMPIDTIVVHHISAIHWDRLTPEDIARVTEAGVILPDVGHADRKYHPAYCRALLVAAKLSYHYLIDRMGTMYRLVGEDRVAWHAGVSTMPTDGREWVNSFSIGVSLLASHPNDDPEVAAGQILAYTDEQYDALRRLIADVRTRHPIRFVVGHDEISPGRKTDPGERFDWTRLRKPDLSPQ